MINKVIIGILIFIVALSGGLGYFSYTLYTQVGNLGEQLADFQEEQTTMIAAVNSELIEIKEETLDEFGILRDELQSETFKTLTKVEALEADIGEGEAKLDALGNEVAESIAMIDAVKDGLDGITAEIFQSVMNAPEVYKMVKDAAVRISDGRNVIGSGFIFDDMAHVVTAQHVVENLSSVFVVLPDGRVSKVTVIGGSQTSDVAVLKLDEEFDIEPLQLADSAKIEIGEPVAAIGNPFELGETLTIGVVSQKNRFVNINGGSQTRWVTNLIQFDAAVNFGNSGGPLFNAAGEVIGMVIARIGPDEGDGINYAVSSNKIKRVANSIIDQGYFDYPWLGIGIADLTPLAVQSRDLSTSHGVLVGSVLSGGPAQLAGIIADDIILAVDGMPVSDSGDLTSYLGENKSPGEIIAISLIRGSKSMDILVEVGKQLS